MLDKIKSLLEFKTDETENDKKLNLLISFAVARLKLKLGGIEPPEEMDYIIIEVVVKRFNRIGSEGLSIHTVEGESLHFTDDDFKEFEGDIQAFLDSHKQTQKGKVRFI
jgi:hypothetical protein